MARQKIKLDDFRKRGDDEAAKALEAIWADLGETDRDQLMMTLGRWNPSKPGGPLPPSSVRAYLEQSFPDLPKKDWDHIKRAQFAFKDRHALRARIVLAAYSLPILYIHPEISVTLAGTGELLLHVRRRLEDTQAFVDAVMTPGSLASGQAGQQWIRKVRLTHALIRKKILDRRAAQHGDAGGGRPQPAGSVVDPVPLDQVELAFVLQTFAWVIVEGLGKMWWSMPSDEAIDHIHAWSAIGGMLGIEDALLPRGDDAQAKAKTLFEQIRDEYLRRGDPLDRVPGDRNDTWLSGRLLAAAWITVLVQIQRERTPAELKKWLTRMPWLDEALQQLPRVLIRKLCGVESARILRITRAPLLHTLICHLALMLVDVRTIAADEVAQPSGAEMSGALM